MAQDSTGSDLPSGERDPGEIVPIPFDPHRERERPPRRGGRRFLRLAVTGVALILMALVWFTFTAVPVRIETQPEGGRVTLTETLLKFWLEDRFLLRPVEHSLRIERQGYVTVDTSIHVEEGSGQSFSFTLTKLPGRLRIQTSPAEGARVRIDGKDLGVSPLLSPELAAGGHYVEIGAERYLPYAEQIEVEGEGKEQLVSIELTPGWANIALSTSPAGATLSVDGEELGTTPGSFEILAGARVLKVALAGYNTWTQDLLVEPSQPQTLPEIVLLEADAQLTLTSKPSGAQVSVAAEYRGVTPLTLFVPSGGTHEVTLFKPGYDVARRLVDLDPGQMERLEIELKPQLGVIELTTQPDGARLEIDGRPSGAATQRLTLVAVPHRLVVRKDGYAAHEVRVTPQPGLPQRLAVRLQTEDEYRASTRKTAIVSKQGQRLVLVSPGRFIMGSSRREQGRRPNEVLRSVELKRPYYIGVREISNGEFRAFLPSHRSKTAGGHDLDGEAQPVTSVSWQQAARFCNWLSARESLLPAYVEKDGKLVVARPLPASYRLPTEAEWVWAARFSGGAADLRYAWGDQPKPETGNYADRSAKKLVANTLPAYSDGFAVAAPVGTGKPNALGLLHLGGNVAEWVNDFYTIYPATPLSTFALDPLGPTAGRHHVLRGASWRVGSMPELRLAFRDYEDSIRDDLGFRIARYAD